MKATTRVGSFKKGNTYCLEVFELNTDTGKYELVWSMVRAKPFVARVLHSKGNTSAFVKLAKRGK